MAARALFISFEGIDGSGKSSQVARLVASLDALGHPALATREPGGSPGAEEIRALLVQGAPGRWSAQTEILLFTAARRDHLEKTVLPALAAGRIVVTDRFADSTRAYQGAADAGLRALVDRLHDTLIGREPDLTLIIDLPPEIAAERRAGRERDARKGPDPGPNAGPNVGPDAGPNVGPDARDSAAELRFERKGEAFQAAARAEFLAIAAADPARCRVIDGRGGAAEVAQAVLAAVTGLLER